MQRLHDRDAFVPHGLVGRRRKQRESVVEMDDGGHFAVEDSPQVSIDSTIPDRCLCECQVPAVETAPREPVSPYGTAKLAAEEYIRAYNRLYGTIHVALRFGNVYGPRQESHLEGGVVAIFLGTLAQGNQATIFGDGLQTRDFVYVGDVARATAAALGLEGGVFNVGTGRETSIVDLYALCARVAGSDAPAEHAQARLGELQRSVLDPELAARELGFRAMVELEDGLQATWDWVRSEQKE